jgi:hypothetical protein
VLESKAVIFTLRRKSGRKASEQFRSVQQGNQNPRIYDEYYGIMQMFPEHRLSWNLRVDKY